MYVLLKPLGAAALRPLVEAAHAQAAAEGRALLAEEHNKDEVYYTIPCYTTLTAPHSPEAGACTHSVDPLPREFSERFYPDPDPVPWCPIFYIGGRR